MRREWKYQAKLHFEYTACSNHHAVSFVGSLPISFYFQARIRRISWFAVWLSHPMIRSPKISRSTVTWSSRCRRPRSPIPPRGASVFKITTLIHLRRSMSEIYRVTNTGRSRDFILTLKTIWSKNFLNIAHYVQMFIY